MNLLLIRSEFTNLSTIGQLYVNGAFFCYTLEDKDRGLNQSDLLSVVRLKKVFGLTAIPYGAYQVRLSESQRFKRTLPEILDVKAFTGVRIHRGNTAEDSHGCLIVGFRKAYNTVFDSGKAEIALVEELKKADKIILDITK